MNKTIKKIFLVNIFVFILFNFVHPITPEMFQNKNIPDSFNGIAYAFMSLGMVFGSFFWGKKLLKYKSNYIMGIALMGYGFSQILFGFSQTLLFMSLARFLGGSFAASWTVSTFEYINQNTPKENKAKYFAYMMVTNALGGIIGQNVAGYLGTKIWIYDMFVIAFLGLLIMAFISMYIFEPFHITKKDHKKKEKIKLDSTIIRLVLLMLFMSLVYTTYTSQIGYYVSEQLNGSSLIVGEINSYTSFIMVVVNVYLVGKLSKHFHSRRIIIMQCLVSLLGVTLILRSNMMFIFSITLFLIGVTGYRAIIQKSALEDEKQNSLMIISLLNSSNSVGMVLGSSLSGLIYMVNPNYIIYFMFIILLLATLTSLTGIREKNDNK